MSNIESQDNAAEIAADAAAETAITPGTLIDDADAIKAIKAGLSGSRKVFDDFATAAAKMQELAGIVHATTGQTLPLVAAGYGNLAKAQSAEEAGLEWTAGEYAIAVGFLSVKRPKKDGGMAIRALICWPQPTVSQYDASESGHDWLKKIAEKETAHVAFRHLRNVEPSQGLEALYQTAARIPTTTDAFAQEQRQSGLDTTAFDAVWSALRKKVVDAFPALKTSLPAKGEVITSIRSAHYAAAEFPDLEQHGIFRFLGETALAMAESLEGKDAVETEELESWVTGRDELKLQPKEREALTQEIDLSAFSIA